MNNTRVRQLFRTTIVVFQEVFATLYTNSPGMDSKSLWPYGLQSAPAGYVLYKIFHMLLLGRSLLYCSRPI